MIFLVCQVEGIEEFIQRMVCAKLQVSLGTNRSSKLTWEIKQNRISILSIILYINIVNRNTICTTLLPLGNINLPSGTSATYKSKKHKFKQFSLATAKIYMRQATKLHHKYNLVHVVMKIWCAGFKGGKWWVGFQSSDIHVHPVLITNLSG